MKFEDFKYSDACGHIDVFDLTDDIDDLEDTLSTCIKAAIDGGYYFLGTSKEARKISNKINKLLYPIIGNKKLYKKYKLSNKN